MTLQRPRRRPRTADPTPYDFRRPIQLSREHQRTLQLGFDGFARQATTVFTSSLRTVCTVTLLGIEQRTYAEYVDSLGPSTYMTLFSADPMPGTGVLEIPLFATMSCLDHMLGGPGSDEQPDRPLTEIEDGVITGLVERLLGEMRYSLDGIVALEPTITGIEYSPQFAQVASAADVMVVVALELRIGERAHRVSICLPFTGLLPHLTNATGSGAVSDRERAQRAQSALLLQEQFQRVPVAVSVRFRPIALDPETLSALEPGSVVRLTHPASAPLDVTVAGNTFAHATPGTRGQRLAALIVTTPEES
ncbi:flagellar motor switch protein FliM [Pimelobacter simplex]|uniref:Flagellar motor switch protein FliM n=1 Tax=Nocardioides simplex TaxID=2045 RepID=A0A0A1DG81_NOCSI|nr:flagellar motor switch protein FliM [Pimelobacter simplex]AIY16314.1 Flagellar motor switch protein FliM [Pimelobacter simplex]MCG8153050.1 flagellar motor switch protein FliM [Pimelobacter simplex]GEB12014.1 flagellar motor switch protein FliM [Pimelobacter simplex]SFN04499.1 flagellar motor switch protein FliM [Pimelobacter simplex]